MDCVEERITTSLQFLAFVNADAGTGKTYTLNTFVARMLLANKQVLCCAYTGIASILLLNGCTFHSHFKASMDAKLDRGLKIKKKTKLASYLVQTDIIVIDEATQLHKNYLEDLDEKLRDSKGNNNPFGGGINDFSRRLQANTTYSNKISSTSSNQGVYKEVFIVELI